MNKNSQISQKLTDTWLKAELKKAPDGNQRIYKDIHTSSHGLMLRISPKGKATFFVQGRIKHAPNQSMQKFTLGDASEMYLHVARKVAHEYKDLMAQGINPKQEIKSRHKFVSLDALHAEYIANKQLKKSSLKTINDCMDRLSQKFKTRNAFEIKRDDVEAEHKAVKERHTGKMADKSFRHVSALYERAKKKFLDKDEVSLLKSNPVQVLTDLDLWFFNRGYSGRRAGAIDTEHLPNLLNAIDRMKNFRGKKKFVHMESQSHVVAAHFFEFMLFTGWRPGDAVSIEWSQVTDDCREVTWNDEQAAEKLKGAEGQYRAPLNLQAQQCLQQLKSKNYDSTYVFPNTSLTSHFKSNPTLYVDKLEDFMGTGKRYSAGIFRKAYQTYAEHLGVNSVTIKRLVFHTQNHFNVQGGYIFPERENLRRKSQLVADFILQHAHRDTPVTVLEIQISSKLASLARKALEEDTCTFDTVSDVIEYWADIGRAFELFKSR
ncbi:Integrase DNA-binding domain-containing protein [Vibrio crassostreae]|nr:Integrase DNA-binding domain-containing protein [Vibrio crassostreae]CAK2895218.1 Integrase DNA-binding domain-containing protein [Vibrio crassostreae]CAK3397215.1 Integrase DNA-binding domain-containing protein [Vibrio crassostreae]CAK3409085.1 Integrase DNA-binding domain-containing protein [Vibrio crassostreae]CAK3463719.1 Integrase DNA-binding domain-containing protein [Vibrio crassostreae]